MNATLRKNVLFVHRWTGLTVGLVATFLALTGLTMVFRPQLETLVTPQKRVASCSAPLALDLLIDRALAAYPGVKLKEVEIAADSGTPIVVYFRDENAVHVDRCTGTVVLQQRQWGGLFGTLEQLHRFRFMPAAPGNLITGSTALLMGLVLVVGGIVVWWPATANLLKSSLRLRTHLKGRAFELNLHRTVGVYTGIVILFSCLTALPMAFLWVRHAGYTLTASPPEAVAPRVTAPAAGAAPLTLGALWERTQAVWPNASFALLTLPKKPLAAAEIYVIEAGSPHPEARSYLHLDPYTGETLRLEPYAASSPGSKIYRWSMSLHKGDVGGILGQFLLFVGILGVPVLGYTGIASYLRSRFPKAPAGVAHLTVKVSKKATEAEGVCSFELADPRGKPLPSFSAGSHIEVHIKDGLTRHYSLCNDPRETHRYLIAVLRDPESRGGSTAFHDEIDEGSLIEIGEPKNHFPLAHSAKRSLLFAGGIGITPILCMAERLSNMGAEFEMHYSSRSESRSAFVDRIRRSAFADRAYFHFSEGRPDQRANIPLLLEGPDADTHLYVCGPSNYMDFVIATAKEKNWPDEQVHREYFAGVLQSTENDMPFDVRIASTGKIFHIAKGQTITKVLAENGVDIPTSCSEGVCGTCVTRIIDGDPDHRDVFLTPAERAKNDQFLPCCSRAKSATLVLDL